ncbi:L,D-transpeptidase [Snodgrassella sp. ESL0253]|uniref:L,D-transpeptidase n=1 Tax=Snodgrassella sp. ESL0253 TaxID=2705031 RepID=UPI001EEC4131|nr:L,D-transpeptidase [Snodgrassella sp. ESL0253]
MLKPILCALTTTIISTSAYAAIPMPDYAVPGQGQQVILNIPQLRLFLFQDGKLIKTYPITVGKASTQTPLGEYKIGAKVTNPTWSVPLSIQKEMAASGKTVQKSVPPGPNNPLGPVFVRLGAPRLGLGIHGTNVPSSVPGVRSHGCVRLRSPNALDFAAAVQSGADAAVIYQQASVNTDAQNDIWIAVYRDPYNKRTLNKTLLNQSISSWAEQHQLQVDHKRLNNALNKPANTLICLTCSSGKTKVSGNLSSLQWTSGIGAIVELKYIDTTDNKPKQEIAPESSSIEVDEDADEAPKQNITPLHPATTPANPERPAPASTTPASADSGFDVLM